MLEPVQRRGRRGRRRRLFRFRSRSARELGLITLVILATLAIAIASFELGKSLLVPSGTCVDCAPSTGLGG